MEIIDTIIIGAGQAGLSVGRCLKERKRPFLILEKSANIGESWANRYDSLTLDSFAKYSHLENFPFPGGQLHHPKKDEVAKYLVSFAEHFDIHPQFSAEVIKVAREGELFIVEARSGVYKAKSIVLATGAFYKPVIPQASKEIPSGIFQLHSGEYRNPAGLQPGSVMIVGKGNSGAEIAEELADAGREVLFSFKGKFKNIKSSPFSQWLGYELGLAHVPKNTLLGKLIIWYTKGKAVGVDIKKLFSHPLITLVGAFVGVRDGKVICEKKTIDNLRNIIWATGYESDFSIIQILEFDPHSQERGITNIPGLYILNVRWQHAKSSSHLAGISRDAKYIVEYIIKKEE